MLLSKLSQDLNSKIIFDYSHYEFQGKNSKKIIGQVETKYVPYYLDALEKSSFAITTELINKIWLHYKILGYPSFSILKVMFSSLFKNWECWSLHCDIYWFVKHKCVTFFIRKNRSLVPFSFIHSDIWGPPHISNISRS